MVAFKSLQHRAVDRELEQRVTAALASIDPIRFRHVAVGARSGVVVLMGQVSSFYAKSLGFQHVRQLPGVESVIDSLRVDADPAGSERMLEALSH